MFWFTGLSGAGKTTIADAVAAQPKALGLRMVLFDGDAVRRRRHQPLGYSKRDVFINNAEIAALCLAERADAILAPIISPYAEGRAAARRLIGERFFEIHICAGLQTVAARDVKGLYAKAARGEIPALIGCAPSAPYEPPPPSPDLTLDTAAESPDQSAAKLTRFVLTNL